MSPPSGAWPRILARIQGGRRPEAKAPSLWGNLGVWRGLTLAGFATAMALAIVLLSPPAVRPDQTMVAILAGADAKPELVAPADRAGRALRIKAVAPVDIADRWDGALPPGGNPRSLGLIEPSGVVQIALSAPAETALARIPALAVSLEPKGGSPTGLPTGPVLYSGPIQRLY